MLHICCRRRVKVTVLVNLLCLIICNMMACKMPISRLPWVNLLNYALTNIALVERIRTNMLLNLCIELIWQFQMDILWMKLHR